MSNNPQNLPAPVSTPDAPALLGPDVPKIVQLTAKQEKTIADIVQVSNAVLEKLADIKITDTASLEKANKGQNVLSDAVKAIENEFKEKTKKYHNQHKDIVGRCKALVTFYKNRARELVQMIGAYKVEKQRQEAKKRQAEERRLREEARKQQEAQAQLAEDAGHTDRAEAIREEPIEIPVVPEKLPEKTPGATVKEVWTYEVTDASALPPNLSKKVADDVAIKQFVDRLSDDWKGTVPGLRLYRTIKTRRTRR